MDVWIVDQWDGEPANVDPDEHDALAWLNAIEMAGLGLADSRLPSFRAGRAVESCRRRSRGVAGRRVLARLELLGSPCA